eukprot:3813291-Alexandrium_andersonii.AAC.1
MRRAAPRPAGLGQRGRFGSALPPPARVRPRPGRPGGLAVAGHFRGPVALDWQRAAQGHGRQ